MKTATIRKVRQNFTELLSWVEAGEEVTITRYDQVIAKIVPVVDNRSVNWKKVAGQQRKILERAGAKRANIVLTEREMY